MQASGILLTISNGHRQPLEMCAQGMVQHSPSTSVTTDGRATSMVVEELEEGLACAVGKCDMTELNCLHYVSIHTGPPHKHSCQSLHWRNARMSAM